jgi:tetratricopeptide (TPR) repeat protein
LEEARLLAEQELAAYEAIGSDEGRAWGWYYLGQIALHGGSVVKARQASEKALVIAGDRSPYQEAFLRHGLAEVLLAADDLEGAATGVDRAFEIREKLDEKDSLAATRLLRARIALAVGQVADATELALAAAAEFEQAGMPDFEASANALAARAFCTAGRIREAKRALESALRLRQSSEYPATRSAVALASAQILAFGGDVEGALEDLDSLILESTAEGLVSLALEARLVRHRIAMESGMDQSVALAALLEDASKQGFKLIVRQARELL